MRWAGLVAHMG